MPHRSVRLVVALAVVATGGVAACSGSGSDATDRASITSASSASTSHPEASPSTLHISDETISTPDGRKRAYRVVVPGSVDDHTAVALVVALHGGIGSGAQFERNSGFDALAAAHGFIVAYPDGIEIGGTTALGAGHVWNGGRCCGRAAREQVDDVGFIRTMIDRIERDHRIDPRRIDAVGHSNGAIMAYRLACELSDRIVAVGVQAGAIEVDHCSPSQPVSVLAIHGTADTNIPINGGQGSGISGVTFSSPVDSVTAFARSDHCGPSVTRQRPDNQDVSVETWSGCADRTGVAFVRVTGASHAWMGHPTTRAALGLTGPPYMGFDSSTAIWEFLAAHPRHG